MDVSLNIAMLIVSISLVGVIILQSRGAGLGGLGGGSSGGSTYHVRRGVERLLFNMIPQARGQSLIFQLNVHTNDPPRVVPEISIARSWTGVAFSPNGKWVALTTPN